MINMNENLISIIVPVYNVEKYLSHCIESIVHQTYENTEIILVDDGSSDKSAQICDEYLKKDNRVRVIHQKNKGLSGARNTGIENASGAYLLFIDSDDYIKETMVEALYEAAKKSDADIVVCDFEKVEEDADKGVKKSPEEAADKKSIEITDSNRLEYMLGETKIIFTVTWNKLYRKELFEELRFPEGKIHEDEFVTYKLLHKADKVIYIKESLYYYVQRKTSIMGEGITLKSLQRLDAFQERMQYYLECHKLDYYYQMLNHYRYFLNEFIVMAYEKKKCSKKEIQPYRQFYKKQVLKNIWKIKIGLKTRIGYLMYAYFPQLYNTVK